MLSGCGSKDPGAPPEHPDSLSLVDLLENEYGIRYSIVREFNQSVADDSTATLAMINSPSHPNEDGTDGLMSIGPTNTITNLDYGSSFISPPPNELSILDYYYEIATMMEPVFGEWNGYFYVHDHNGNGMEEVIAVQLAGARFGPVIFEYHDGEFKRVLPYDSRGTLTIGWEAPAEGVLVIYESAEEAGATRFEYVWNEDEAVYELASQTAIPTEAIGELGLPQHIRRE